MDSVLFFSSFLIVTLLAISLQVLFFSPISPEILEIPSPSKTFTTAVTSNSYLQRVSKLGEGFLDRPEDVAVDKMGVVYTATRDGWIKRKHKNGTWESWKYIRPDTLLGLTVSSTGDIIVCDAQEGLLKVSEDGVSVLASHVNGEKIRFRCLKHWLKDEIKRQTEFFVDNLPGAPDNINLAPDGSFWIALVQLTAPGLNFVHTSRASKHLLATFPKLMNWVIGGYHQAMIVNVAADGKITKGFDDPTGKVMSFVISALEYEDHLYLGSLNCDFIGKLPLTASTV